MSVAVAPRRARASVLEYVGSTDHKRLGVAITVTAVLFFFAAGLLALLMRTELAGSGLQVISTETYNQVFTIHGSTMFFLFASPVVMGVAIYFVPLQLGAAGLVWPRAALFAFWVYLFGGLTMWSGFLTANGAADWAWHAFYPLTDANASPWIGGDLWIVGVTFSQAAVLVMAVCVLATIVRRRAPGMTVLRIPIFTWSMIATILMVIPAYPVIVGAMVLLFLDRNAADVFSVPGGSITWQHLFWFYAHPLVYVVFFPLIGAVAETVATFSRRRFFGYRVTQVALLAFAALSTSVWGHHMMTQQDVDNRFFSFTSTAIAIPAGIEYFGLLGTMWGGRIRLRAPMLFALGFIVLFLIGGLSGIFVGSPPLDYHAHDSYIVVAHFHYTLFGGTVFGLFTAIYYWFPKVTGRILGETLGRWHAGLMFAGALLTFVPMFILGHAGMPREIADYAPWRGWDTLNLVSTIGAYLLFVSFIVFLVNVFRSLRLGDAAGPDPWEGQTLEWIADSPPPPHNFDGLPPVRSYSPLLDLRLDGEDPHRLAARREEAPA